MPEEIPYGGGNQGDFTPVREGCYAAYLRKVNRKTTKEGGWRIGFGFQIADGPFARRYVWYNIWVNVKNWVNKEGVERPPLNYQIRKMQALVDPEGHPLKNLREGETAKFVLEDDDFFTGSQKLFGVEVKNESWEDKRTGKRGVRTDNVTSVDLAENMMGQIENQRRFLEENPPDDDTDFNPDDYNQAGASGDYSEEDEVGGGY